MGLGLCLRKIALLAKQKAIKLYVTPLCEPHERRPERRTCLGASAWGPSARAKYYPAGNAAGNWRGSLILLDYFVFAFRG